MKSRPSAAAAAVSSKTSNESKSDSAGAICHTITHDKGINLLVTTAKDPVKREESMLAMMRVLSLLGDNKKTVAVPSKEDAKFVLENPNIDVRNQLPTFFSKVNSVSITAAAILAEKTRSLFTDPPVWKYNKQTCTAWVFVDSKEGSKGLMEFFLKEGIGEKDLESGKLKESGKPVFIVKAVTLEFLEKLAGDAEHKKSFVKSHS
jgi:hypothetical protein